MNNKLYFSVILCMLIALILSIFGSNISKGMASAVDNPNQQKRLEFFYHKTIIAPLAKPMQPVPTVFSRHLFNSKSITSLQMYGYILTALFYIQVILLARRITHCVQVKNISPPSNLSLLWKSVLMVALISWLIGALFVIIPRILIPFSPEGLASMIRHWSVFSVFIQPYIWLPSEVLLGLTFFFIEIRSVFREGILLRPNQSLNSTPKNGAS